MIPLSRNAAAASSDRMSGRRNQQRRIHGAQGRVGAGRRAGIADPVAGPPRRDPLPHALDHARGLHARHCRRPQQVEIAGPAVDIDEIDPDRPLLDPHLARAGRGHPHRAMLQHLRPAEACHEDRRRLDRPAAADDRVPTAPDARRCRCGSGQERPDRPEPGVVDLLGHQPHQPVALVGGWRESGAPFPEGGVRLGHRPQADLRHVADQRQRRLEEAVGEAGVAVR